MSFAKSLPTLFNLAGGIYTATAQYKEGKAVASAQNINAQLAAQDAAFIRTQADVTRLEADVARQQVGLIRGEIDLTRAKRRLARDQERKVYKSLTSTQQAMYAKAGVTLEGSPMEVIMDSIYNAELDIITKDIDMMIEVARLQGEARQQDITARQIEVEALQMEIESVRGKMEESQYGYAAKAAKQSGRTAAGLTLLTTGAEYASKVVIPKTQKTEKLYPIKTSSFNQFSKYTPSYEK